jgi:hypothetical protein
MRNLGINVQWKYQRKHPVTPAMRVCYAERRNVDATGKYQAVQPASSTQSVEPVELSSPTGEDTKSLYQSLEDMQLRRPPRLSQQLGGPGNAMASTTPGLPYPLLHLPDKSYLEALSPTEINGISHATSLANHLGSPDDIRNAIDSYLRGSQTRMPILAHRSFSTGLIHALFLLLQSPQHAKMNMASVLYFRTKGLISILKAREPYSVQLLQARILIAYYELGHGLIPAAARTVSACAQAARVMKLSPKPEQSTDAVSAEERRRTWPELYNMDKYPLPCLRHTKRDVANNTLGT